MHRFAKMEIAAISRPKQGEDANGDAHLVECCRCNAENGDVDGGEKMLIAVVDGLGHGKDACIASKTAVDFIKSHKHFTMKEMIKGIHKALLGTRGVVIAISMISQGSREGELSYIGVGNISAQIVRKEMQQQHLTSTSGVLGWNLKKVKEFKYDFLSGWLVMNSDGIGRFNASEYVSEDLQAMAARILDEHRRDDDATIVVVRY